MDAKRAFCNYRGLGSYSRLLIESLNYWFKEDLSLVLFTPKVTLPGLDNWPMDTRDSNPSSVIRYMPSQGYRFFSEIWRGYGQVKEWDSLGINIYHGLSNEIPLGIDSVVGSKKIRVKTIVTIHDLIFMRQPELYPWWDRWNYIRKSKYACERADSIIALSEQTKSDLIEFFKVPEEKIKTIYQAVHPRFYKREKNAEFTTSVSSRPYFLFVGAFEERKNVLRLIKAFAKIKSHLLDHELILVGKGRLLNEIQKTIQSLSLEQDIKIHLQMPSEDLPAYYQGSTALLYPSLFEGFGLPIVEALMSETLVMTSVGSCFPESAGPGAFFIDPYQEEHIAQTLVEIVNLSSVERINRIKIGLEHCKKFHWKYTSEQLVSHYKNL